MFTFIRHFSVICCLLVLAGFDVSAQHCPFDGAHLIAVKPIDNTGKMVVEIPGGFYLTEVDQEENNSCPLVEKAFEKQVEPAREMLFSNYERYWENWIKPKYDDWQLLESGHFAVIITTDERHCKTQKEGKPFYADRSYEIVHKNHGFEQRIPVPKESIYSLCTGNGSWKRIKPIEIVLN